MELTEAGIWEELAEELQNDIVISIPTKDVVLYTTAGDKKLKRKMLKLAKEMYESNLAEFPHLCFSKDIFQYLRNEKNITIL